MVPEYLYMDAACFELADRTKSKYPIQILLMFCITSPTARVHANSGIQTK